MCALVTGVQTCALPICRPVVAFEDLADRYPAAGHHAFVALGYSRINGLRMEKYHTVKEMGFRMASYVSPRATVFPNVELGDNVFLLEDNTVQPFVTIGSNVTLWSGNHIGHHSRIDDHCFIDRTSTRLNASNYCS